jgi:general nucleoside transport system permease protein
VSDTTNEGILAFGAPAQPSVWRRGGKAFWQAAVPVVYGLIAGGVLLLIMGKNPIAFYWTTLESGLFTWGGLMQTIIRLAPLLLMSAGFIVAFQAGLWNIGGDGQFLMAAAVVGGLGLAMVNAMPFWLALILLCIIGFVVGGAWTVVPSFLKAYYGVNEIITTLMMAYLGINLANLLIKGPFLTTKAFMPQTDVIPFDYLLPYIPGTRIHVGIIIALVVLAIVHYMQTRTAYGLRLRILGANPRAAVHAGINVKRDIMTSFALSGALIGLAAAVEVLGVWGYVRADWNPAFGMTLFALVFLAGLNVMVVIPFVFLFAVIQIGGHEAARQAGLPNDFLLLLVGLILFFMVLTEWARTRGWTKRARQETAAGVEVDLEGAVSNE